MSRPYVTALIDTFNHERFIERAVASVLEQDFPSSEMEVLVVDDGSTDATPEILSRFSPRIRILRKTNGGQASAFNFAIPESRAEIIAFLDGDDWWKPGKLNRVAGAMRDDPDLGLVGHCVTEIRPDGREQTDVLRDDFRFRVSTSEDARIFRLRKTFLGTSRMTLRAALARDLLPVPEGLVVEADEYLFTLAAVAAAVEILPEALTFYRIHDANQYSAVDFDSAGLRKKYSVMAILCAGLRQELGQRGLSQDAIETVVSPVQAEADQLRLSLDGGWPWETARTEWHLFRVMCERPTLRHRIFKLASLAPALLLPPRMYYAARERVVRSRGYLHARQKWIPIPVLSHVKRMEGNGR
jgi:hypothetical protein